MTLPRTAADVLADHVVFEVESIDRMMLNVRQPRLQYPQGVYGFFVQHRGNQFPSPALMEPMTREYVAGVRNFIAANDLPVERFTAGQRKDDVTGQYLAGHDGSEVVLYVGTAQERARVWTATRQTNPDTGALFTWLHKTTRLVKYVYFYCFDADFGLKGLPEAITTVWSHALVQACVLHLIRNTFRYASRKYWEQMAKDLRPVYTAPSEAAAAERFAEFTDRWGQQYPAIVKLWENSWSEFVPFLDYDVEIRRVICSTNAIESLNTRYRRAIKARRHFATEQAALKCLYLVTRSLDPTGRGRARWAMRWKPALNAFAITFPGRIVPSDN